MSYLPVWRSSVADGRELAWRSSEAANRWSAALSGLEIFAGTSKGHCGELKPNEPIGSKFIDFIAMGDKCEGQTHES